MTARPVAEAHLAARNQLVAVAFRSHQPHARPLARPARRDDAAVLLHDERMAVLRNAGRREVHYGALLVRTPCADAAVLMLVHAVKMTVVIDTEYAAVATAHERTQRIARLESPHGLAETVNEEHGAILHSDDAARQRIRCTERRDRNGRDVA